VSAANPGIGITADSLATIYGDHLATQTVAASSLPWPTALGDIPFVMIVDSASHSQPASLIYVSPNQMNIWIPPGTAAGAATVSFPVTGLPPGVGTAALRQIPVTIQKVAPALFSIDGSGTGVAAATAIRVVIPSGIEGPVPVFQCVPSGCTAVPISLGIDTPIYLSFYGTGIRGASGLANVSATIGGTLVQALYAGAQAQIPGLDQVNVPLPLTLRGSGVLDVTVTVDGVKSNAVQIIVQ
jgi:uncharacterized protein (TIGR03437 family)